MKIPVLIGLSLSSIAFLTLGSFTFNNKKQYNNHIKENSTKEKNIEEYEKLREEFYSKKLYDPIHMCDSLSKETCLKQEYKYKHYFPLPNEDKLWEELYKELEVSNKAIRELKTSYEEKKEQLTDIKDAKGLRDYCYQEIKVSIDSNDTSYFNVDDNTNKPEKAHEKCVLIQEKLEKLM